MQTRGFNIVTLIAAFLRELLRGSRATEQRPARPKVDARLAFLLSLPENELRAIRNREQERLQQIQQQITDLQVELDAASEEGDLDDETVAVFRARFDALDDRLFAPLTSGLYFPGDLPQVRFKEPHVTAFILSDASSQDLAELGVNVRTQAGDIFTADVPLSKISALEASAAVRYIELSPAYFPALETSVPFAQINTLHSATPAVTGAGVIVGIVDWYLDIYHPDFRNPQGPADTTDPTRVLFLWDQYLNPQGTEAGPPTDPTLPGFLVGGTTYGVEYDQAAINTELANYNPTGNPPVPAYQTVRHGGLTAQHGTHVAGIAAGNGRGLNTRVGAAPGADIIFVMPQTAGLGPLADAAGVMDAFAYIFARASQLGQACVVNFSGSRNMGPHDGTAFGEQFLDNLLLTPGRAITLAAGNTDNKNAHAAGQVAAGGTTNLVLNYFGVDTNGDGILDAFPTNSDVMEIWYDGHDRFTVTVTEPNGTVTGPVAPGTSAVGNLGGGLSVDVISTVNDPRNGDNVITVIINVPVGSQIPVGNWNIALAGTTVINGSFQAWVERNNRGLRSWQAPHLQAGQLTIGGSATGVRTLAVGNHNKAAAGATPTIYVSSGRGPTRDGRVKPEVAATGAGVNAARSRNMNAASPPGPGALYTAKWGTSMAAPLVGGACALLFECRGAAATWADLKQIVTDTAANQGMAAGVAIIPIPSNAFGFGYLQMGTACTVPDPDVDVWLKDNPTDLGVEPLVSGGIGYSPDIEVLDTAGAPVPEPTHDSTARYNNIIQVTVRNRGTQTARNTEVYFYWAEPSTNIPFPAAWNSSGIYTDEPADFTTEGNKIVIPELAAGANTQVRFAWAPPDPAATLSGGNLCLLVRLENESDPSQIGAGGFLVVGAKNNIAQLNVTVQPAPPGDGAAEFSFFVTGSADVDGLIVESQLAEGEVELSLPARILPWRDSRVIDERVTQQQRGAGAPRGCLSLVRLFFPGVFDRLFPPVAVVDPVERLEVTLDGADIKMRTDVEGAKALELREGVASIVAQEQEKLFATRLRLAEGERHPVRVRVRQPKIGDGQRLVSITQLSGGRPIGAVWLELRPPDEFEG